MKRIGVYVIPIISIVLSSALVLFSAVSLTFVMIGQSDSFFAVLGKVFAIIAIVITSAFFVFSWLFVAKSKLCRIATGIYAVALGFAIASVVLM